MPQSFAKRIWRLLREPVPRHAGAPLHRAADGAPPQDIPRSQVERWERACNSPLSRSATVLNTMSRTYGIDQVVAPLQGAPFLGDIPFPGRCPGLSCCGPAARNPHDNVETPGLGILPKSRHCATRLGQDARATPPAQPPVAWASCPRAVTAPLASGKMPQLRRLRNSPRAGCPSYAACATPRSLGILPKTGVYTFGAP